MKFIARTIAAAVISVVVRKVLSNEGNETKTLDRS